MTSLTSDRNYFKEVGSGTPATITVSGTCAANSTTLFQTSITHNLGKIPRARVYMQLSSGNWSRMPLYKGLDGAPGILSHVNSVVTTTQVKIWVQCYESSGVARSLTTATLNFRCFIYTE